MAKKKKETSAKKNPNESETEKTQKEPVIKPEFKFLLDDFLVDYIGFKKREDFELILSFYSLSKLDKVKESRKIIQDSIINAVEKPDDRFALAIEESETLLKGYATLDDHHRNEIQKLIDRITAYLNDSSRKRPLNTLMIATPGAGKSHFIKRLAHKMKDDRVQAVTFNMATMQSADDMAQPIDELRNLKVNDRFPLLFLDEFDSDPSRYASLLPLLWDGELQIGHRDLKLGKAVIVLAGSNPELLKAINQSAKMRLDTEDSERFVPKGKLIDLVSRINGGEINIPELDLRTENRDRRVDKVCLAISLMKGRFGDDLKEVPRSLLTFIAQTTFRYGARSIAHLIDVIDSDAFTNSKALKGNTLDTEIGTEAALQESSLKWHIIDKDQVFGIVNRWKECSKDEIIVELKGSPPLQKFLTMYKEGERFLL